LKLVNEISLEHKYLNLNFCNVRSKEDGDTAELSLACYCR